MADFYDLLGVSSSASAEEIKKAYRKRARELHPDANPDDAEAEGKFKDVARAYQVLSDATQRQRYDQFGEAGVGGGSGGGGQSSSDTFGGGLGDIFDAFFSGSGGSPFGGGGRSRGPSGPPRGQDLETVRTGSVRRPDQCRAETASRVRRLRRHRCRRRHQAGDLQRLWRRRPGTARSPKPARPDGHSKPVWSMRRYGPSDPHTMFGVSWTGPSDRRQELPG
jgi:DnaJ-class molecular chaperone